LKSFGNLSGAVAAVDLKQFNMTQMNMSEGGQKFAILIVDDNSMN
jgi:hypothetical protein